MDMKTCTGCGIEKELDDFSNAAKGKNGKASKCRKCYRQYQLDNKELIAASQRKYYLENKEKVNEYADIWRKENPEKVKQYREKYKKTHKKELLEKQKEERILHPERVKAREEKYRQTHPENVKEAKRKWKKNNPEETADYGRQRRARINSAEEVEKINKEEVIQRDEFICHLCLEKCERKDIHLDHIIPISKGGSHSYSNTAVSHSWCNLKKSNKIVPSGSYANS